MNDMIGKSLGKYQIIEPLGEGGMATVYKAFDPGLERYVAVKIIRTVGQVDPNFLLRFQREARALAKLDHPYILKVLDYGEQDGMPYLVMPYLAHGTLKKLTRSRLPYDRAINILLPIADALSYAHKRKIIHRDIKPANILFGESDEPILSDFGIAKILDQREQVQLTNTGLGIGTPAYMAPEQWNGVADERTDIYALGIVLYELITGRCPFQADTPAAILIKQVQDPLPRPRTFAPDIPETVEKVIFKALAKDPSLRFQTMQEFIVAMQNTLPGKTTSFIMPPPAQPEIATQISYHPIINESSSPDAKISAKKNKWLPWIIAAGALFLVVCVLTFVLVGISRFNLFKQSTETPQSAQLMPLEVDKTVQPSVQVHSTATRVHAVSTSTLAAGQPTEATPESLPITNSLPTSESILGGLPEDVALFLPNNGDISTTQADQTLMLNFTTGETRDSVVAFYRKAMSDQNWELISTSDMPAQQAVMFAYQKDNRNTVIYIAAIDSSRIQVQIIINDEN